MMVLKCLADNFAINLYCLLRTEMYTTKTPRAVRSDGGKRLAVLPLGQHDIPLWTHSHTRVAPDTLVGIDMRSGHLRYLMLQVRSAHQPAEGVKARKNTGVSSAQRDRR